MDVEVGDRGGRYIRRGLVLIMTLSDVVWILFPALCLLPSTARRAQGSSNGFVL